MKSTISDELFNEVYNYEHGWDCYLTDQILNGNDMPSLSDMATRCKIYAIENGYEIWSGLVIDKSRECGYKPVAETHHIKKDVGGRADTKDVQTEAQAVIRATEYVYKKKLAQRKNKNKDKR